MSDKGPLEGLGEYLQLQVHIYDICQRHGGSVTGGPRTHKRNYQVGGHPASWHLWDRYGLGVDLVFDTPEGRDAATAGFQAVGYEVIGPYDDGHIHVEPAG